MLEYRNQSQKLEDQNSLALSHYRSLPANFEEILCEARSGASTNEGIANKLAKMEVDVRGVGDFLSHRLQPKYYNQIRKDDSTIASQVFSITELAELTLSFMDATDIMAMEQVNRFLRRIIEQSPTLQVAVCLKPGTTPAAELPRSLLVKYYDSPFGALRFPGFSLQGLSRITAAFTRLQTESGLPKIGPRWMKSLICNPPIKSLDVCKVCAVCKQRDYNSNAKIVSNTGLTLRDLYEKAEEVFAAPTPCQRCAGALQLHNVTPVLITTAQSVDFHSSASSNNV